MAHENFNPIPAKTHQVQRIIVRHSDFCLIQINFKSSLLTNCWFSCLPIIPFHFSSKDKPNPFYLRDRSLNESEYSWERLVCNFFKLKLFRLEVTTIVPSVSQFVSGAVAHGALFRSSKKTEQEKNESEKFLIGLLAGFVLWCSIKLFHDATKWERKYAKKFCHVVRNWLSV